MVQKKKIVKRLAEAKALKRNWNDFRRQFDNMKSVRHHFEEKVKYQQIWTHRNYAQLYHTNKACEAIIKREEWNADEWKSLVAKKDGQVDEVLKNLQVVHRENVLVKTQNNMILKCLPAAFQHLSDGNPDLQLIR